jgi:hypothetical protein
VVDYRTHEHPVWRERADALIHLPFTFDGKEYVEQLWTRHETDDPLRGVLHTGVCL